MSEFNSKKIRWRGKERVITRSHGCHPHSLRLPRPMMTHQPKRDMMINPCQPQGKVEVTENREGGTKS